MHNIRTINNKTIKNIVFFSIFIFYSSFLNFHILFFIDYFTLSVSVPLGMLFSGMVKTIPYIYSKFFEVWAIKIAPTFFHKLLYTISKLLLGISPKSGRLKLPIIMNYFTQSIFTIISYRQSLLLYLKFYLLQMCLLIFQEYLYNPISLLLVFFLVFFLLFLNLRLYILLHY